MQELIKITENEQGEQVVSARLLYDFLEVKTAFTDWCKRMFEYGFEEGKDFIPFLGESNGGRPSIDYVLLADTAKEISMLQRTEKGKEARIYFIYQEKIAKGKITQLTPKQVAQNWLLAEERAEAAEIKLLAVNNENEALIIVTDLQKQQLQISAPKVKYVDEVLTSHDGHNITIIAKELNTTPNKLNKWLKDKGVQFLSGNTWVLKVAYQNLEYTKSDTHPFKRSNGETGTHITTKWTEKGRLFIHDIWGKKLSIA